MHSVPTRLSADLPLALLHDLFIGTNGQKICQHGFSDLNHTNFLCMDRFTNKISSVTSNWTKMKKNLKAIIMIVVGFITPVSLSLRSLSLGLWEELSPQKKAHVWSPALLLLLLCFFCFFISVLSVNLQLRLPLVETKGALIVVEEEMRIPALISNIPSFVGIWSPGKSLHHNFRLRCSTVSSPPTKGSQKFKTFAKKEN